MKHVIIFLEDLNPCPYPNLFITEVKRYTKYWRRSKTDEGKKGDE
jgi:hypothetical protein